MGMLRAWAVILWLSALPALAQNHALLIDRSGSMVPYYGTGLIQNLGGTIQGVMAKHGRVQIFAFSTEVTPTPSIEAIAALPPGSFTYLDHAMDYAIRRNDAIVWIVTDNIQDQPGSAEAGNTEVFYQKLRNDAVKKVSIFPLLQRPGLSGVVIYAVLLSQDASDAFEQEINEFLAEVKGVLRTEGLRMKPLDAGTMDVSFVRGNLQPKRSTMVYREGEAVHEKLTLRFKSKFEHLRIVDAMVGASRANAEFGSASLLRPEKREIAVSPERITSLDPLAETGTEYQVDVDLGKVKLKKDLASLWKAAWGKSGEEVNLNVQLVVDVPRENFKFKDSFLTTYNAATPELARSSGKICRVESLPMLLGEKSTALVIDVPLPFRVEYPWWPAFMWVMVFLIVVAGGIALAVVVVKGGGSLFARSNKWNVTAESAHRGRIDASVDNEGAVFLHSDQIGSISKNRFTPAEGVTIEDGAESVKLEDGVTVKVDFRAGAATLTFTKAVAEKAQEEQGSSYTPETR